MNENSKNNNNAWWQPALVVFAKLSAWIAAPVLIGTILGKWLDEKCNSEPWMFIGTVGVAFVFSMIGLIYETIKEFKKIENNNNEQKNKK